MSKNKTEKSRRIREQAKQLQSVLSKRYPLIFNPAAPKPLAIGFHLQLREALPDVAFSTIRRCLFCWTRRHPYFQSLKSGAARYNLDGSESGHVTADEAGEKTTD